MKTNQYKIYQTMNKPENNFCVILAGGKGRRLWPSSRETYPKQFVDFFGVGRTQLQQTYDRMIKVVPKDNIYLSTVVDYLPLVKEQLPEVPDDHILAEPLWRNTAASVAWATFRIFLRHEGSNIIVAPSDHAVQNEEAFLRNMQEGLEFVSNNYKLLTFGVKPTRPEPGYGYVQMGEELEKDVYAVQSFTEKPEREFARMFMESGEFLWNTGIFLSCTHCMLKNFDHIVPPILRRFEATGDKSIEKENEFIRENFSLYPNFTIDFAILEKIEKIEQVCVMKADFGWADLGTWHSMYESLQKTEEDNVVIDSDVMLENCRSNIIRLPKGRLGVINGLKGFIVAEKDNVLLICPRQDSSALIRKYINEVRIKRGKEFL